VPVRAHEGRVSVKVCPTCIGEAQVNFSDNGVDVFIGATNVNSESENAGTAVAVDVAIAVAV